MALVVTLTTLLLVLVAMPLLAATEIEAIFEVTKVSSHACCSGVKGGIVSSVSLPVDGVAVI